MHTWARSMAFVEIEIFPLRARILFICAGPATKRVTGCPNRRSSITGPDVHRPTGTTALCRSCMSAWYSMRARAMAQRFDDFGRFGALMP